MNYKNVTIKKESWVSCGITGGVWKSKMQCHKKLSAKNHEIK